MIEFLQLPEALRRQIIEQVSARADISVKSIEKDWWVTLCLKDLYYDQGEVFCALEHVDKTAADARRAKWNSFVADKPY